MAKRNNVSNRKRDKATTLEVSGSITTDALEERLMAFADELGRIAGTVQGRAEGWVDRETLLQQIASVRDGAAGLLKQLVPAVRQRSRKTAGVAGTPRRIKGRSGGVVDAPGKKHRGPGPADPRAKRASSPTAAMPTAKLVKAYRRRGRR